MGYVQKFIHGLKIHQNKTESNSFNNNQTITYGLVLTLLQNHFILVNVSNFCILRALKWPHDWLKHLVHCVYKLILIYLCASVGTVIVYI